MSGTLTANVITEQEVVNALRGQAPVNCTAATLEVTADLHAGKTVTLNRAAGIAVTLPEATGSGDKYRFFVGTTITSNATTITAEGDGLMFGTAVICNDSDASVSGFETGTDKVKVSFNGSTTGGIKGDIVELEDVGADLWAVVVRGSATGDEATPFAAAG